MEEYARYCWFCNYSMLSEHKDDMYNVICSVCKTEFHGDVEDATIDSIRFNMFSSNIEVHYLMFAEEFMIIHNYKSNAFITNAEFISFPFSAFCQLTLDQIKYKINTLLVFS